jgi:hypothetical protein
MKTDTMIKKEYAVSMGKAQIQSLPFLIAGILPVIPFGMLWGWKAISLGFEQFFSLHIFVPVFLGGILLHELIHAYTWKWLAGLSRDQLKLGIQWKTLTPYAHSKVPMALVPYRWGAVMPLLLLGVLPYMVSLATGNGLLAIFSVIFMSAAAGDMLILWMLRKVPPESMVEDHPTAAGCYVYEYQATTSAGE